MTLRKCIALILTVTVSLVYIPIAEARELPEQLYMENGGQIFRMDLTDFLKNYEQVAQGTGTLRITMSRAVLPGSPAAGGAPFTFSEGTPDDLKRLGTTPDEVMRTTGIDLSRVEEWSEVVSYGFIATEREFSISYRIGTDSFVMTVPKVALQLAMKDLTPDVQAAIEVNGVTEYIEMSTFFELAAHMGVKGELPEGYEPPQSIAALAPRFDDLTQLINGYQGFQFAGHAIGDYSVAADDEDDKDESCVLPCLECAAKLLASIGTAIALVAACGATVASGGTAAALCVAAFIAHQATHIIILGSCADCHTCISDPAPEPEE
jgi:hypothetical protein